MSSIREALEFVAANRHAYLLGRRADQFPTGYPMTAFAAPDEGVVRFSTYRASAKVRNLEREGVATVLSRSYAPGSTAYAVLRGRVEVTSDASFLEKPRNDADAALLPGNYAATAKEAHASGKRCILLLTVDDAYLCEV